VLYVLSLPRRTRANEGLVHMMGLCSHNTGGICDADSSPCVDSQPWCGGSVAWALGLWGPDAIAAYLCENQGKDLFV